MPRLNQNLAFSKGEDVSVVIQAYHDDVAYTITGGTLTWKMFHVLKGLVLTKDNALIGGLAINGDQKSVTITIQKNDTKNLAPLTYKHELWLKSSGNAENDLTDGFVTLNPSQVS